MELPLQLAQLDVAAAVEFLLSDQARNITGTQYYAYRFDIFSSGARTGYIGEPRTFGGTVTYHFGGS